MKSGIKNSGWCANQDGVMVRGLSVRPIKVNTMGRLMIGLLPYLSVPTPIFDRHWGVKPQRCQGNSERSEGRFCVVGVWEAAIQGEVM